MQPASEKLLKSIESFQKIWHGGFRTGYTPIRNQAGLEKYLLSNIDNKCVLEIGCGGGQWSKAMYNHVDKLYSIDVLSAAHNRFWAYVGEDKRDKITYCHVKDFSLSDIPENSIDYVFSYDVFCHIPLSGQEEYLKNLYSKCKKGAILCVMYADAYKFHASEPYTLASVSHHQEYDVPHGDSDQLKATMKADADGEAREGRWFWPGVSNFVRLCEKYDYTIISKDLNIDKTNPITLFKK